MPSYFKAQPFDCMQYLYKHAHDPVVRFFIEFDKLADESTLKKSVEDLCTVFPLLRCRYSDKKHRWINKNYGAENIFEVVNSEDTTKHLLQSVTVENSAPLKVILVRKSTNDALIFVVSHMVCDGGALKQLVSLFAKLYNGNVSGENKSLPELSQQRNLNQVLKNIGLKKELKIFFGNDYRPKQSEKMHLPLEGGSASAYFGRETLTESQTAEIHAYAKARGASVNDMLLTAFSRTLHKNLDTSKIVIPCPVDLRKYGESGGEYGICNLTSNFWCETEIDKNEPFETTLKKISSQMKAQKKSDACLKGPMTFHTLFHLVPYPLIKKNFLKISPVPVTSYTNVGVLADKELSFSSLNVTDAFIATALKRKPCFQLSVTTFHGRCNLTSTFLASENDKIFIDAFLADVKNELLGCV